LVAKNKPYEQFGPYILFKKLEADALGELWRAGKIEGNQLLGSLVALRRLTGGNREALTAAALAARDLGPMLTGTSFARHQVIDVGGGIPFLAHDYAAGRSLRHIVDRARGGSGVAPQPIPIEQAVVIAERVALSLATTADMRYNGQRLNHGGLIPQFIWISDDGEIRVAGQQLASGLLASLKDPKVAAEIARYFAPEAQTSGDVARVSDVYSMGAILFLLVTGQEPPDPLHASAFAHAVRNAKTMAGTPIPADIRVLLDKSLNIDPGARYPNAADMKQALSALAHGGAYSATTFNLAFYLSNLLKKEFEGEAVEREKESKINVVPYLETQPGTAAVPTGPSAPAIAARKSRVPIAIAATLLIAAIGLGAYFVLGSRRSIAEPTARVTSSPPPPPPTRSTIVSEPLVATPEGTATTAALVDDAAQKRAFEEAVNRRLQEELMKLQSDFNRQLQRTPTRNAPATALSAPAVAPVQNTRRDDADDEPPVSAADLDQQRRQAARIEETPATTATVPAPVQTQTSAPPAITATTAPAPATPAIREGDLVEVSEVDTPPRVVRSVRPLYPPIAARQRLEGTVLITALISERGDVLDARILGGEKRFGFDDAALRAVRATKFSPAIKDGKRVKTWFPIPVNFKL
jgi:protein TonB